MRKTGIVILTILVAIGLMGGAAMANGWEPAKGKIMSTHGPGAGGYGAYVKLSKGTGLITCNGEEVFGCCQTGWTINIKQHASVAQWAQFSLSATKINWRVLKPGVYRTNTPIRARLKSNGDAGLYLSGFGNMFNTEGDEIEVYYRIQQRVGGNWADIFANTWEEATNLDNHSPVTITEDQSHNWYQYMIRSMIEVGECDSACEYNNRGTINIVLEEQKCWVARLLCSGCP